MAVDYSCDPEYANDKLAGSYIRDGVDIVSVNEVTSSGRVYLSNAVSGYTYKKNLEDLDLTPPTFGYCNLGESTSFVYRVPTRYWRQGFRTNTMRKVRNVGGLVSSNPGLNLRPLTLTMRNMFPSYKVVCDDVLGGGTLEKAFSRNFCLDKRGRLYYKTKDVGNVNTMTGVPQLENKYSLLQEALEESMNR